MKKNLKSSLFDKNTVLERTSLNACQGGISSNDGLLDTGSILIYDTGFSDPATTYNPQIDFPESFNLGGNLVWAIN